MLLQRFIYLLCILISLASAEVKAQCLVPAYDEAQDISHKFLINIYDQLLSIGGEKRKNAFCLQYKQEYNKRFELFLIPQDQTISNWSQVIGIDVLRPSVLPVEEGIIPKGYEVKSIFIKRKKMCRRSCGIYCKIELLKESEDYIEFTELCGKDFRQDDGNLGRQSYYILHKKAEDTFMLYYHKKLEPFDVNDFKIDNADVLEWKRLIDQNIRFLAPSDKDAILYGDMLSKKEKIRVNIEDNTYTHIVFGTKIQKKALT